MDGWMEGGRGGGSDHFVEAAAAGHGRGVWKRKRGRGDDIHREGSSRGAGPYIEQGAASGKQQQWKQQGDKRPPARACWGESPEAPVFFFFFFVPVTIPTRTRRSKTRNRSKPKPRHDADFMFFLLFYSGAVVGEPREGRLSAVMCVGRLAENFPLF